MVFFALTDPCSIHQYISGDNETVTHGDFSYFSFPTNTTPDGSTNRLCDRILHDLVIPTIQVLGTPQATVEWATKPFPQIFVIANAILFLVFFKKYYDPMCICVVVANVVALTADLVIIPDSLFLIGLAIFLVMHFVYITAFSLPSIFLPWTEKDKVPLGPIFLIPVIIVCLPVFIWLMYSMITEGQSGVMVAAVGVYGLTEICCLWRVLARIRYPYESHIAQGIAFVGMLMFVSSDVVLAVDRFYVEVYLRSVWVLGLYWLANNTLVFSMMIPWGTELDEKDPYFEMQAQ